MHMITNTKGNLKHTHTHTNMLIGSWPAREGFIHRALESDISMALSRVSMAIPCTEIIRGDPRLRRSTQQGQIYISSRVERPPSPSFPLPSFFIVTVDVAPLFTTLQKPVSIPHFCRLLTEPALTVAHGASPVKTVRSLLSNSEASPVEACLFHRFLSISPPSISISLLKKRNSASLNQTCPLIHHGAVAFIFTRKQTIAWTQKNPKLFLDFVHLNI